jgi:CHAT domain-containing protein
MDIYKKLIPDEFKRALWDKKDEIKNIFVISDEEWIPWEIIKPFRISESGDTEVDEFWCLKYAISRWLPCYFPEKRIFVGKSALIAYDNNGKLKHVPAEVKIITEILRSEGVDVMSIEPKRLEVLKQLNDSEMNLIHFACESTHNERSPDDSDIKLEDDGLKARDIGVTNLRKGRPLVCISACESGRTGYTFSGIGGFAKAFLDVGSQAFIGPMWRVPDRLSAKFSEELYRNIFEDGLSVGEALKTARHKLMTIKNPAWMSYLLYSSPVLRIAKKKEVLT